VVRSAHNDGGTPLALRHQYVGNGPLEWPHKLLQFGQAASIVAAKRIDRLARITEREKRPTLFPERDEKLLLARREILKLVDDYVLVAVAREIAAVQPIEQHPGKVTDELRAMASEPVLNSLPELRMLLVFGLMVAERLLGAPMGLVLRAKRWKGLEDVVKHCFSFVVEQQTRLSVNHVQAQGVDSLNYWRAVMRGGFQQRLEVRSKLLGDDPIEGDDQDVLAGNGETIGV
jgi:hypothetical protein